MEHFYTVYDQENFRVGFAPAIKEANLLGIERTFEVASGTTSLAEDTQPQQGWSFLWLTLAFMAASMFALKMHKITKSQDSEVHDSEYVRIV